MSCVSSALAGVVVAAILPSVSVAATAVSTTWDGSYEADVLPEAAGWTSVHPSAGAPPRNVENGILSQNTHNLNVTALWTLASNPGFNFSNGTSVEVRTSVEYSDGTAAYAVTIADVSASAYVLLGFSGTNVILDGGAGAQSAAVTNISEFHTYRVTIDSNATPSTVKLYLDDGVDPFIETNLSARTLATQLRFGDFTGANDSTFEVDYLRWTADGAYAPVPEPAALSSLVLLPILMRRWRSRSGQ